MRGIEVESVQGGGCLIFVEIYIKLKLHYVEFMSQGAIGLTQQL